MTDIVIVKCKQGCCSVRVHPEYVDVLKDWDCQASPYRNKPTKVSYEHNTLVIATAACDLETIETK